MAHGSFSAIVNHLNATDLLVVNNTRVIPARLRGQKDTGGKVEALLLDYTKGLEESPDSDTFICQCLVKASKRPREGALLNFGPKLQAQVISFTDGIFTLRFLFSGKFDSLLTEIGEMPLPPYIRRTVDAPSFCDDSEAYQTVYASRKGAVAAPTAGLHFSNAVLDRIRAKGVEIVEITLHVGYGTFLPVRVRDIRNHRMHRERYIISPDAADAINGAKRKERRIIAVGTTSIRTLEHASDPSGRVMPGTGDADLFIYPGYRFKTVDGLVTNFHLPRSTLLMLVSAFAGRSRVLAAYRAAVDQKYRFFSYGDAMLIL